MIENRLKELETLIMWGILMTVLSVSIMGIRVLVAIESPAKPPLITYSIAGIILLVLFIFSCYKFVKTYQRLIRI